MREDRAGHECVPEQGGAARLVLRVVLPGAVGSQDQRRDQPLGVAKRLARGRHQRRVAQLRVGVEEDRHGTVDQLEPGVHTTTEADVLAQLEDLGRAALPAPCRLRAAVARARVDHHDLGLGEMALE